MLKRSIFTSITVGFISLLVLAESAPAGLTNGDFSFDLSSWDVTLGSVTHWPTPTGAALFSSDTDKVFEHSTLSQSFLLDEESLTLSFDFLMETDGGETDVFTASLDGNPIYTLSSDFGDTSFDDTFSYDVSSLAGQEVVLVFDLKHDYDDDSNTTVMLDKVSVELVPVPSAVILGSFGLTFSGWLLKRRKMV